MEEVAHIMDNQDFFSYVEPWYLFCYIPENPKYTTHCEIPGKNS